MKRNLKIRDRRNKGWFYLDNDYLNGYAKYFGAIGTAIYVSLCRHANGEQKCFPSQNLIARELNISERTVIRYLKRFETFRLIEIERENTKNGRWLNNVYTLLDRSEWIKPTDTVSLGTVRLSRHSPCDFDDRNHVTQSHSKDTNRKKTNKKERKIKNTEERLKPIKREINDLVSTFRV